MYPTPRTVDHRLASGVDLAPQIRDIEVDDAGAAAEPVIPYAVEDFAWLIARRGLRMRVAQQFELRHGQRDLLAAARHLTAGTVKHQIAYLRTSSSGAAMALSGAAAPRSRATSSSRLNGLVR